MCATLCATLCATDCFALIEPFFVLSTRAYSTKKSAEDIAILVG